jgi:hypothetical protein
MQSGSKKRVENPLPALVRPRADREEKRVTHGRDKRNAE